VPSKGRQAPTIRDVAKAAGVSMTTVSDVVNGKGRVDPVTRERVKQAVLEVGWRPRRSARALRSGNSGVFALCFPRRDHGVGSWLLNADYDMALVAGCAAATVDAGRQLLLAPRPRDVSDLVSLDVDGVILADPQEGDPAITVLNRAGIPVVTVERDLRRTDGWWVECDTLASTHRVLDHLTGQGAERIALITSDAPWAWFEDTSAAYADWCQARGDRPLVRLIDVDDPRRTAAEATRGLLASRQPPDAIFAVPLHAPLGVLEAAAEVGCGVPGDLLLAAGIDAQTLQVSSPPVTAVDLRPLDAARAAVSLLERRIAGEDAAGPVVVETVLVPRTSTGLARPAGDGDTTAALG
jgi:DNA-binding LacI/PurR family transcriptional regulator